MNAERLTLLRMRLRRFVPLLPICVSLAVVIDGDTLRLGEERIRLLNIDAPEVHSAGCDAERRLGLLARKRLQSLLDNGQLKVERDKERSRDRYGRTLARVKVDGVDVGERLIDEGYVRRWSGRRSSWCDSLS